MNPDNIVMHPEMYTRFHDLAAQSVATYRRMGNSYWTAESTRPLRDAVDQLKRDCGLTETQFNLMWQRACEQPNAHAQKRADKRTNVAELIGAVIGILGFFAGAVAALTFAIPASLWSGIVCESGYQLKTSTTSSFGSGGTSRITHFACVGGDTSVPVELWVMVGLNAIPALLLTAVVVLLFVKRGSRRR